MRSAFELLKSKLNLDNANDDTVDDFVDINPKPALSKARVVVRPFVVEDFSDIKPALDAVREGYTIAMLNIKPLKEKDLVELKRAVSKLKKTCEAMEGDIAGLGEDWIVITPSFATVYRAGLTPEVPSQDESAAR